MNMPAPLGPGAQDDHRRRGSSVSSIPNISVVTPVCIYLHSDFPPLTRVHTVKSLPCPELRLRSSTISTHSIQLGTFTAHSAECRALSPALTVSVRPTRTIPVPRTSTPHISYGQESRAQSDQPGRPDAPRPHHSQHARRFRHRRRRRSGLSASHHIRTVEQLWVRESVRLAEEDQLGHPAARRAAGRAGEVELEQYGQWVREV